MNPSNRHSRCRFKRVWLLAWIVAAGFPAKADVLRVLPPGERPPDVRLGPLKDLNGYFPFHPPASREAWLARREYVRRRILVSLGLWPMPPKTPLNPIIHGRMELDGYSVEKVFFESLPGFYVTGNLYRPRGRPGPFPLVLCPHGHWPGGRFMDAGEGEARRQIATGAERFVNAARSPLQARCVQLARLGCVVFHYDMIGYADSIQLSRELAHGFRTQRPEMIGTEAWGLFSPQAESLAQSVMGLQTWNSIRALDFGLSLPEVDPARVAVTGASGGGTQSFILAAIEDRLTGAFPAVMVSTAMQGGCTCENACGLRIGTGNVEFAALNAPRPLGLTSANDWTVEMATKGFPELQALYRLLGAEDRVELRRGEHFGHNYNHLSRTAMYGWINRLFHLGWETPVLEADFHFLNAAELTVWDESHPAPVGGPDFERQLLRRWRDLLWTCQEEPPTWMTPPVFRHVFGKGLEIVVGRSLANAGAVNWEPSLSREASEPGWRLEAGLLRNRTYGEALPALAFEPVGRRPRATVVWVDGRGKAGLLGADGQSPSEGVLRLMAAGARVVSADVCELGEFRPDGQPLRRTRRVDNPREAAAYTLGYNHSLCAQRAHDVLTLLQWVRRYGQPVWLLGVEGGAPWAVAAMAVSPGALQGAALDTRGFRFFALQDIRSPDLLPGAARYGDLQGMLATGLPPWLALAGEKTASPWLLKAAGWQEAGLDLVEAPPGTATERLLGRLIERIAP